MKLLRSLSLATTAALVASSCGEPAPDLRPNWYRDVEPVVAARCATCHQPGGITPFALQTYAEVKEHAAAIADAVATRRMPPWVASPTCNSYKDERILSQAEIDVLVGFERNGALLGDEKDRQLLKVNPTALPWVDQTLTPAAAYTPNEFFADKTRKDDYRCFMLDPGLVGSKDLIGFEVVPGERREVHHVIVYAVNGTEAQALEDASPGLGWPCFGGPGSASPKMVGGWVPGSSVVRYPGQTGLQLYAGDVLVMQIHYNLGQSAALKDLTQVKLQYAVNPVQHHAQMFPLLDRTFEIPPNSMGYTRTAVFETPVEVVVWGVVPHLHTKGVSAKVEILPPTNEAATCLVDVPKWDFQWQQFYFVQARTGVSVKAGSTVKLTCTWNNPTPNTVRWGESTDDEMCLAFLYITGGL